MAIINDLFCIILGRLAPLSLSVPSMLIIKLEHENIRALTMPKACFEELSESIIEDGRARARIARRWGGDKHVHAQVLLILENQAPEIARILQGKALRTYNIVEPGFRNRVTEIFRRHGVAVPEPSDEPWYVEAIKGRI